jgi:hypothetical protein
LFLCSIETTRASASRIRSAQLAIDNDTDEEEAEDMCEEESVIGQEGPLPTDMEVVLPSINQPLSDSWEYMVQVICSEGSGETPTALGEVNQEPKGLHTFNLSSSLVQHSFNSLLRVKKKKKLKTFL